MPKPSFWTPAIEILDVLKIMNGGASRIPFFPLFRRDDSFNGAGGGKYI
jgi:hypothetical protein